MTGGVLTGHLVTSDQAVKGWYRNYAPYAFPILASNTKLLPFQVQRAITGNPVTVFKLVGMGTEVDLSADIANITIYTYSDYEYLVYTTVTLTTTLPSTGHYYIHLSDGSNTWYFDYMRLGSYPLSINSFGAYTSFYTSSYQQGGFTTDENSSYYILNFINLSDLEDKVYQNGYEDILILRHEFTDLRYIGRNQQITIDESTGKEVINQIFSYDEYELNFFVNRNVAKFLDKIKLLDKFTITLPNTEQFTSYDFDCESADGQTDQYKKVTLKYRTNYMNLADTTFNSVASTIAAELG